MRHNPRRWRIVVIILRALKMHGMAQAIGELTEQRLSGLSRRRCPSYRSS